MSTELRHIFSPRFRWLPHLVFWIGYLAFYTILYGSFNDEYLKAFIEMGATLPVKMAATYFMLYWLIPKFIFSKQYLVFAFLFVPTALLFGYLDRLALHFIYMPLFFPDYDYGDYPLSHIGKAIKHMIGVYTVVFAAVAIKLIKRNYQNEQLAQALNKEKMDAELKFLKAQIHPHFLFNTLNNLYALTLRNETSASEVVLKLSNLLDYMLYECNVPEVPLNKEIKQINNFIGLEKLRYGERLEVSFTSTGNTGNKKIAPLLILPFVENAFKHGVSQELESTFVSIDLSVKGDHLSLKVENSKASDNEVSKASYTKGIGLRNVQRRLDLLYPDRYDLQVFNEEDSFLVVLKLQLNGKP